MNNLDQYDDVTSDVIEELQQRVEDALKAGIKPENIMIDPGFGFAKNAQQNLKLLHEFHKLNEMGYPILSALSRKRFIGEALGGARDCQGDDRARPGVDGRGSGGRRRDCSAGR